MPTTTTQAVSPGYIYTVTASSEAIVRDVETDKLLCKANNGKQGMFVAIGGTVSMATDDPTATITQSSTTSGGARFEVQQTRPATGEEGVIYLIPITSGTEEENEYEEWIWVKGEWERLGTTGVNLSNYATLTGANTYSGDNTFNGLLLKKNSASLGDTSVLNRSEADARYGRLNANNIWYGVQQMESGLTIHPTEALVTSEIQGHGAYLGFNNLHLTNIKSVNTFSIEVDNISSRSGGAIQVEKSLHLHDTLYVDYIQANRNNVVIINDELSVNSNLNMHSNGVLSVETITSVNSGTLYIDDNLSVNGNINTDRIGNHGGTLHIDSAVTLNNYTLTARNISAALGMSCSVINLDAIDSWSSLNVDIIAEALTISGTVNAKRDISIHKNAKLITEKISSADGAGGCISIISDLRLADERTVYADYLNVENEVYTRDLRTHNIVAANTTTRTIGLSDVKELQFVDTNGGAISGINYLRKNNVIIEYDNSTVPDGDDAVLVAASNGIKVTANVGMPAAVTIDPSKIEAFQLNTTTFGANKYGLRLTQDSCQLFGVDFASNSSGSIVIGNSSIPAEEYSVAVGKDAMAHYAGVAIGMYAQATDGGIGIGYDVSAANDATALGYGTTANNGGVAIGRSCSSDYGTLNLSVGGMGNGARCSMLFYGGSNYAARDNTGYLKFEIGDTLYNDRYDSGAQNDTITISKPNLWSALDRAKYRGAQPYASYATSAVSTIPALEPNSITHVYSATGAAIDLSDITLAQHDTAVTTAELWIEVTTAGATITWPEDTLWPDEADPTTAPSFPGPEASAEAGYTAQRLYCVTLRTQPVINVATGNADTPVLIATIAYTLDHKVSSVGS